MDNFTGRFKALLIDGLIVTLLTWVINGILYVPLEFIGNPMLLAYYSYVVLIIVTMAYFTIFEGKSNRTIGKKIAKLYVSDEDGYMTYKQAFVRNISKIFWLPLIVDVILGKILRYPSRFLDKIAGTDVYSESELELV